MVLEEKFIASWNSIITRAIQEAKRLKRSSVQPEDLLLALLHYEIGQPTQYRPGPLKDQLNEILDNKIPSETEIAKLLQYAGVDYRDIKDSLEFIMNEEHGGIETNPNISERSGKVLGIAHQKYTNDREPRLPVPVYVLYAILSEENSKATGVLESEGMSLRKLEQLAENYRPKPS